MTQWNRFLQNVQNLCLQGQFGRALKSLSLDGVAPDNKKKR